MDREFWGAYLKRSLMFIPALLINFIPPYPISAKIGMTALYFVILLLLQLVELATSVRNARMRLEADREASDDGTVVGDIAEGEFLSRKERRKRARTHDQEDR
jgi:hypothetical protein